MELRRYSLEFENFLINTDMSLNKKSFLFCICFQVVTAMRFSQFIGSLIQQHSAASQNSKLGVVFIGIEQNSNFDVFDELVTVAMRSNPESPVFIHKSFDSIGWYQVNTASFIVMTTTIQDQVR